MVSTELLEQVRTSMERVGLEGFYDLVVEMVESSDNLKISVTGIMRELGLPRPTVKAYMEVLREELAGALEAAA